jgi:phosphatidylinositol-bisphosphatase
MEDFADSDVIVLGIQECENIKPRRHEGSRSRKWRGIQAGMYKSQYRCIVQHKIGGLQLAVHVRRKYYAELVQDVQVLDVACGLGNVLTNKGAICALLRIKGKTLALTNAHFAAHVDKVNDRNADFCRVTASIADSAPTKWLHPHSVSGRHALERRKAFEKSAKYSDQPWLEHLLRAAGCPPEQQLALAEEAEAKYCSSARATGKGRGRRKGKGKGKGRKMGKDKSTSKSKSKRVASKLAKAYDAAPSVVAASAFSEEEQQEEDKAFPPACLDWPFDGVIFFGDLNYRLDLPRLEIEMLRDDMEVVSSRTVKHGPAARASRALNVLQNLLNYDQLRREMAASRVFTGFQEGQIDFLPTFKYDRESDVFDSSSKLRPPAWTDRVLYFVETATATAPVNGAEDVAAVVDEHPGRAPMLELVDYKSITARHSDHRPVMAKFRLNLEVPELLPEGRK